MFRCLVTVSFLVLGALGALAASEVDFAENLLEGAPGERALEELVLEGVNARRVAAGAGALEWDERLASAARQHAVEMAVLGYFTHESPTPGYEDVVDRVYLAGLTDRTVGENLVITSAASDEDEVAGLLVDLWAESPVHRAELLNEGYNYTGVGVFKKDDNYYCAQVFSRRLIEFDRLGLYDGGNGVYVLSCTGRVLNGADAVALVDGPTLTEFAVKNQRFSFEYSVPAGSGLHEIYFFAGATSSHGLAVSGDRPLEDAFMKDALVVDLLGAE